MSYPPPSHPPYTPSITPTLYPLHHTHLIPPPSHPPYTPSITPTLYPLHHTHLIPPPSHPPYTPPSRPPYTPPSHPPYTPSITPTLYPHHHTPLYHLPYTPFTLYHPTYIPLHHTHFSLPLCVQCCDIVCPHCDKVYTTQAGLRYHINTVHRERPETPQEKTIPEQIPLFEAPDLSKPLPSRRAAAQAIQKMKEFTQEGSICKGEGSMLVSAMERGGDEVREDADGITLSKEDSAALKLQLKNTGSITCPQEVTIIIAPNQLLLWPL